MVTTDDALKALEVQGLRVFRDLPTFGTVVVGPTGVWVICEGDTDADEAKRLAGAFLLALIDGNYPTPAPTRPLVALDGERVSTRSIDGVTMTTSDLLSSTILLADRELTWEQTRFVAAKVSALQKVWTKA